MKALAVTDILPHAEYEKQRAALRKEALAQRERRRFELADACVVIFENRGTVQYQVQEMLRVDKDDSPERIALELSCFNLLIPGEHELSATLVIRVPEYREVDNALQRLNGITRQCISLRIGDEDVYAHFDVDEDTLVCDSDVFYIRFSLTPEQAAAFSNPAVDAVLRSVHEKCMAEVPVTGAARKSLIEDLNA
ncbi:MAG: DUF3501 family protein [Bacteroidota bacterium]|nr:DUF3501 family protein [Bacteroidota bacterium]